MILKDYQADQKAGHKKNRITIKAIRFADFDTERNFGKPIIHKMYPLVHILAIYV